MSLEQRLLAAIMSLPEGERADAIHALLADMMKAMPASQVLSLKYEIMRHFDHDIPIIASTINLIDGHLALREINP